MILDIAIVSYCTAKTKGYSEDRWTCIEAVKRWLKLDSQERLPTDQGDATDQGDGFERIVVTQYHGLFLEYCE